MPLNQSLRKNCHILWTISLIQDKDPEAQTKAEFAEMVGDVVENKAIESVSLCLADNLQRFRLMIQDGINEEDAVKKCQEMAIRWHQDNAESLEKLKANKNLSLLTWKEFLTWPDRIDTIKALENWYSSDRGFRNDVDGRVRQALQSIPNDARLSDPVQQTALLKQYLFEECAFQKFAATKKFQYELYKTPTSKAMRRVKNNSEFVPPGYMVEVHFTQFNPSAKKQQANQAQHLTPSFHNEDLFSLPSPASSATPVVQESLFLPVFANHKPKNHQKPTECFSQADEATSPEKNLGKFIKSAIRLLPPEQRDQAMKDLVDFTLKNIVGGYYLNNQNGVKI